MKKLLVVDDHPIVLEGIQSVLSRQGYAVVKATSAAQAMSLVRSTPDIDIVVADLSLSEACDGLELVGRMKDEGIYRPTIVYTMHEELWNIAALMKADVEGIVLKGDNIMELIRAIECVAGGGRYVSESFTRFRENVMSADGILSSKDVEILRRITNGESNRDISLAMCLSEKSIEYHRRNILRKLGAKTMTEATKKALLLGIVT